MTEPKSCPVCGGKPHFNECSTLEGNFCMVVCSDNYHSVLVSVTAETKEKAKELAIKKWNIRVYPPEVQKAVEMMRPKKVLNRDLRLAGHEHRYFLEGKCPTCGDRIRDDRNKKLCDCGQRIDWSEE